MQTETKETIKDKYQTEFEQLPLDEKYARLFKLEAVALSETFEYVMDSSGKVFEQAGAAISDFAKKFEHEAKETFRQATQNADCGAKDDDEPKSSARTEKPAAKPSDTV